MADLNGELAEEVLEAAEEYYETKQRYLQRNLSSSFDEDPYAMENRANDVERAFVKFGERLAAFVDARIFAMRERL